MVVYLNGTVSNTTAKTGSITEINNTAFIGGDNTSYAAEGFNGLIDEVKIYNVGLNTSQVMQDSNLGSALDVGSAAGSEAAIFTDGAGNPPIAYWPLDERQDNTCTGGTNDACDKSGNAYDGAGGGSPLWTTGKFGQALQFTSNYINFGDLAAVEGLSAISFSAWVNPTSYGPGTATTDVRSILA